MNRQELTQLNERLADLDRTERKKLYQRASRMRQDLQKRLAKSRSRFVDEDEPGVARRTPSLDELVFRILKDEEEEFRAGLGASGPTVKGTVVWSGSNSCRVRTDEAELECMITPSLHRVLETSVVAGDEVEIVCRKDMWMVARVLPRRTVLSRPDVGNNRSERVIVANVDLVVVVVSVIGPPLHPRVIDRYLIAIQRGGSKVLICVNKTDLLTDQAERETELAKLDPYRRAGINVVEVSAANGDGIRELTDSLRGLTCAFVGHSGVGKSSIVNAICPEIGAETGEVSEGYGRGTHTTTASSLYDMELGTRLIDTPGIRSFGLWQISRSDLPWYFPEFEEHMDGCKFRDCTHTHEPECGVIAARDRGEIAEERYDAYLRIRRSYG